MTAPCSARDASCLLDGALVPARLLAIAAAGLLLLAGPAAAATTTTTTTLPGSFRRSPRRGSIRPRR